MPKWEVQICLIYQVFVSRDSTHSSDGDNSRPIGIPILGHLGFEDKLPMPEFDDPTWSIHLKRFLKPSSVPDSRPGHPTDSDRNHPPNTYTAGRNPQTQYSGSKPYIPSSLALHGTKTAHPLCCSTIMRSPISFISIL